MRVSDGLSCRSDTGSLDGFIDRCGRFVPQAALDSLETTLRLEPGDAIFCDNHRVLHGRHAFVGHRRLLGCYLQADDWRSRLRVLQARAAATER